MSDPAFIPPDPTLVPLPVGWLCSECDVALGNRSALSTELECRICGARWVIELPPDSPGLAGMSANGWVWSKAWKRYDEYLRENFGIGLPRPVAIWPIL